MAITKKISRGVKISSGLVLLGLVAGTFLGQWLPDFDGGEGVIPVKGSKPAKIENTPVDTERPKATTGPRDVLLITIKGRSYWVEPQANEAAQEVSLERAVELAKAAAGDEDGIRVRVNRDGSARAKAEEDLEQALLEAGVTRDSIVGLEQTTPQ